MSRGRSAGSPSRSPSMRGAARRRSMSAPGPRGSRSSVSRSMSSQRRSTSGSRSPPSSTRSLSSSRSQSRSSAGGLSSRSRSNSSAGMRGSSVSGMNGGMGAQSLMVPQGNHVRLGPGGMEQQRMLLLLI